jgi:uncharacterized protein YjiS (DUF1127 family)
MSSESQFHHDYPSITHARETARHTNFMPRPGYAFTEGRRERRKLSAAYESQEHSDPNGPQSAPFTSEHSGRSMPNTAVRHGRGWGVFPKLVGFASRLHHRWKIRQTIIYADDIDDRTLKDIGVTRYELRHAAKHGRQL